VRPILCPYALWLSASSAVHVHLHHEQPYMARGQFFSVCRSTFVVEQRTGLTGLMISNVRAHMLWRLPAALTAIMPLLSLTVHQHLGLFKPAFMSTLCLLLPVSRACPRGRRPCVSALLCVSTRAVDGACVSSSCMFEGFMPSSF
jgi:hypothetical protein